MTFSQFVQSTYQAQLTTYKQLILLQIIINMETHLSETFVICSLVLSPILYCVFRIIYKIWWRPISLEKLLRRQGIRGTSFKLLRGDTGEMRRSTMEALSKPMPLQTHHIAPRVLPFFYDMVQRYGENQYKITY